MIKRDELEKVIIDKMKILSEKGEDICDYGFEDEFGIMICNPYQSNNMMEKVNPELYYKDEYIKWYNSLN